MTTGRILLTGTAAACLVAGALAWTGSAQASQLVYQPINPAFGGDPFIGSFLMETAQAQNRYAEEPGFPDIQFPDFDEIIVIPPPEDETAVQQVGE